MFKKLIDDILTTVLNSIVWNPLQTKTGNPMGWVENQFVKEWRRRFIAALEDVVLHDIPLEPLETFPGIDKYIFPER